MISPLCLHPVCIILIPLLFSNNVKFLFLNRLFSKFKDCLVKCWMPEELQVHQIKESGSWKYTKVKKRFNVIYHFKQHRKEEFVTMKQYNSSSYLL